MECKNTGHVYECSECDYVSYRKVNTERHRLSQHVDKPVNIDKLNEKVIPQTVIQCSDDQMFVFICSGKKLSVFKMVEDSLVNFGTSLFTFNVESLETHGDLLVTCGQLNCCIDKFSIENDKVVFENVDNFEIGECAKKSLLLKDNIVFLLRNSVGFFNLEEKMFSISQLKYNLTDMTLLEDKKTFLLILDENGQICYVEEELFASQPVFVSKCVEGFKVTSVCSLFYSKPEQSSFLCHENSTVTKIQIQNNVNFSDKDQTSVKVRNPIIIDNLTKY